MKDNQTIGLRIAGMRKEKKLTQTQLAVMLGVSHQAVSKWESGQALPDVGTMLELTKMFGCTVEELIGDDEPEREATIAESNSEGENKENNTMNMKMNELLQMAAYMSKEAVGEIAMKMEGPIAAWELAKLAPFVKQEVLEQLIEKHHPELTWDALRKLAPFMSREKVDQLAREISEGKRSVHPTQDEINKTLDDIGKTFDDIGKSVGKALDDFGKGVGDTVQRVLKFGGEVFNDVSEAFSDLASDITAQEVKPRSERAAAIRRKAFERAITDGRFDWIADHMAEIEDDAELKSAIAAEARRRDMHDWISAHMNGFADEVSIQKAIENGDWEFLGENVWQFEQDIQEAAANAAVKAENWAWLEQYSDQLTLGESAAEIARAAMASGAKVLARQICEGHMNAEAIDVFAKELLEAKDYEGLSLILHGTNEEMAKEILIAMAKDGEWVHVEECIASADDELKETMMEIAVDAGDFDAIDMLDRHM